MEYIKTLPLLEEAEVFGQHPNSEILYRIQEGESILKNLGKFLSDNLKYKEENLENEVIFYLLKYILLQIKFEYFIHICILIGDKNH